MKIKKELENQIHKVFYSGIEEDNRLKYSSKENYGYFDGTLKDFSSVARLRLDFNIPNWMPQGPYHQAMVTCVTDLEELLIYGDKEVTGDVWLKSFDGEIKRGRPVTKIDIFAAEMIEEKNEETREYTFYVLMYVEFGRLL